MITARPQSLAEEIANSASHGLGFLLALAALPVLIVLTARTGHAPNVVGASIFAVTIVLLYLTSTIYHALPEGRAKKLLLDFDHGAIFLFIAGSYTPFSLGALHGESGWWLVGLIWTMAVFGIAMRWLRWLRHPLWSTGLYLAMGWLVLIVVVPLVQHVPKAGLAWLVAGGLCYTVGVVFYLTDGRVRFGHLIWHLFVLAGTFCHFFAVLGYASGNHVAV